jgi:hypothetical protein
MKAMNYYDRGMMNRFFTLLAVIIMLAMFSGCAGGNYGKMEWNRELDNTFTSYQVLPDHRYYITGGYGTPAAILAIHNDYLLDNDANIWVGVPNVSPAQMKTWIDNLSDRIRFWNSPQFMAAYILDPNGKRVGAWYSGQRSTTIKFLEGNRIKVYPPDLKPALDGGGRGRGDSRP